MKLRIKSEAVLDSVSWNVVKGACLVILAGALLGPAGRTFTASAVGGGVKTVMPATIKAGSLQAVAAASNARVASVLVTPGQTVRAGQLMATLENEEVRRGVERARLRVQLAEERSKAPARTAKISPATETQTRVARRAVELGRQRIKEYSIADAEAAYASAKARLDSVAKLRDRQLATSQELDNARRDEQNEKRNLMAAREHLSRLHQELESAEAQLSLLAPSKAAAGENASQLSARLEVEEAQEALNAAVEREKALSVTAPFDGTVLGAVPTVGEQVTAGATLFQVADLSKLAFDCYVSANVAQSVKPGAKVTVRIPSDPPIERASVVSSVSLLPDANRQSYAIRAFIPNPNPSILMVGMEGNMEFTH